MKFVVLLFAVLACASSAAIPEYKDKEVLYKYEADFRTGVIEPYAYGSHFHIKADLHGQFDEKTHTGVFYFSNVKIAVYNGELTMDSKPENEKFVPMSEEFKAFEYPFMVEYTDEVGLFKEMISSAEEPRWIVNIKKSVVSLFQFNWKPFDEHTNSTTPTVYISEEDSIYGECTVSYAVEPQKEHEWTVTKYFDPKQCSHTYNNVFSTYESYECESGHIDSDRYSTENKRVYHIAEHKSTPDAHYFEKIESYGEILFNPLKSMSEQKYSTVKQTVEFVKYQQKGSVAFEHKYPHKFEISYENMSEKEILDATLFLHTTFHFDDSKKTPSEKCIYGIEHLAKNYSNADYYNYVLIELSDLKVEDLETCAKALTGPHHYVETLYKVLPLLGTRASLNFIKNIVKTKEFPTATAMAMLQYLPFYVIVPSEQILTDLNEFIDPNFSTNVDIKYSAILAYSNLIYKTFKLHPESPVLRKYVKTYYTYLKTATTYADQFVYLQGLKNIEVGYVWELLLPLVKGEQVLSLAYDYHLREHAIWASYKFVYSHPKEFYTALWPIIIDQHAHTNIRIAAVKLYIDGSQTMGHLKQLYTRMHNETNTQVYNFFVTSMTQLSESHNHCETPASRYADFALEHFAHEDSHINSYAFSHEHIDEEYGMGAHIYGNQMANFKNQPQSLYVQMDAYALHKKANVFAFYFKFEGAKSALDVFLNRPKEGHPVHYEFMKLFNGRVVYSKYFDFEASKKIDVRSLFQTKNEFVHIMDLFNYKSFIHTDLGLPLIFTVQMPVLTKIEIAEPVVGEQYFFSIKFEETLNGRYGLLMYNRFSDVRQGVMREVNYDFNFDLNFKIGKEGFSMTFNDDKHPNYFNASTHVQTVVYMIHDKNPSNLDKVCDDCTYYQVTTEHSKYLQNFEDVHEFKEFGLEYTVNVTDCEGYFGDAGYTSTYRENVWYDQYLAQFGKVDTAEFFIHYYNFFTLHLLSPQVYSCGHTFSLIPSESYPVDKFIWNFNDVSRTYKNTTVTYEFNPSFEFVTSDKHQSRTWETKFDIELEEGYISNEFSAEIFRVAEGKPTFSVCFDYENTFEHGEYSSYFNYYEGHSFEHECVHDQFHVTVYSTAEKSEEQKTLDNATYTYHECEGSDHYSTQPITTDCIKAYTSLRHETYHVEYKNLPLHHKTFFQSMWSWFKHTYNYDVEEEQEKTMLSNTFTVELTHPVQADETTVDVTVSFPRISYAFEEIHYPFISTMENTHFDSHYYSTYDKYYSCMVRTDKHVYTGLYITEEKLKAEKQWQTLFDIEHEFKVEVMQNHEHLSMKITMDNNTMTVHYDDAEDKYYYAIDETMLQNMMYPHTYDVTPYGFEMLTIGDTNVYLFSHYNVHVIYNSEYVKIETEDFQVMKEYKVTGTCF